ncbi:hypothetical protein C1752_07848 [Acaryochloris thomasi RCC1774]|uniref:Uncharacterized protein n=1 Tax=Acaryochloris thomasi RCC1774 TaxID=1764569 RepID=A0A2W1JAD3_9CYAN|nr:hypothetical protein [Acaryochloris thomasi]PZD71120.1 hypothetical protein C1752_07848 [Acaryochloris thomasi RCC1774]
MFATKTLRIFLMAAIATLIAGTGLPMSAVSQATKPKGIETLADGDYQFCSQPVPKDWRDGAGACFSFAKRGDRLDGYYGFPHSGDLVCLRGRAQRTQMIGQALVISWPGHTWSNTPPMFQWKLDNYLTLNSGYVIRSIKEETGPVAWIQFDAAVLNLDGFYQYPEVKMSSPEQLCGWDY